MTENEILDLFFDEIVAAFINRTIQENLAEYRACDTRQKKIEFWLKHT